MRRLAHLRFVLPALLAPALLSWMVQTSSAAAPKSDRVSFSSSDSVELSGTFYPSTAGGKDAVVLFLHDFDPLKGGGSHGDWDKLAARLQKEGYSVLSFDFRGFGGSKAVRQEFWDFRYNQQGLRKAYHNGKNPANSIDQKEFASNYYLALINDIAAARAFLDRKNDSREVNTSNLFVIGAGDGATLGALWASAEMHRQKDSMPPMLIPPPPRLADPEGKDIAALVWLSINPTLARRSIRNAVSDALVDVARDNKTPTAFYYGGSDVKAKNLTAKYLKTMKTDRGKTVELKLTGEKAIPGTVLTGSKLLGGNLKTAEYIVKYLNSVMEERGTKEWKKREEDKSRYFWTVNGRPWKLAKPYGEKIIVAPIPPRMLKLG